MFVRNSRIRYLEHNFSKGRVRIWFFGIDWFQIAGDCEMAPGDTTVGRTPIGDAGQRRLPLAEDVGLQLADAKPIFGRLQEIMVSEQLQRYCEVVRPCPRCHRRRHLKDHRCRRFEPGVTECVFLDLTFFSSVDARALAAPWISARSGHDSAGYAGFKDRVGQPLGADPRTT
jgi:hypothetical protein